MSAPFLLVAIAATALAGPDEWARELRHKDVIVRFGAVDAAVRAGGKEGEALLLLALRNDDWEVVERAAAALATRGSAQAADKLSALCIDGPVRRVREAAARSAAKIDPARTVAFLAKAARGADAVRAFEALAAVVETGPNAAAAIVVDEGLSPSTRRAPDRSGPRARDPVRAAAASAIGAFPLAERAALLSRLALDPDPAVASSALDAAARAPDVTFVRELVAALMAPSLPECVERRIRIAVHAAVAGRPQGYDPVRAAKPVLDAVAPAPSAEAAERAVRLMGILAAAPTTSSPGMPDERLVGATVLALKNAAAHSDSGVRAAAAASLGRIAAEACAPTLAWLASNDGDAHVRIVAVHSLARCGGAKDRDALAVLALRVIDADREVREEAAAALGVPGVPEAVPLLAKAVERALSDPRDPDWRTATVALVSLGRTRDGAALPVLRRWLRDPADWRTRASAAAGLGRLRSAAAVPDLVDALDDKSASVRATALESLVPLAGRNLGPASKAWRAWWHEQSTGFVVPPPVESLPRATDERYGSTPAEAFAGFDVILNRGASGDGAHESFDHEGVAYRVCRPGGIEAAGLHPAALVVCGAGEVSAQDVDALAWFVRAGGLLATTGFDLQLSLAKVCPGRVRAAEGAPDAKTKRPLVPLSACAPWDPSADGVFARGARTSRLATPRLFIEVLDPDRVEVPVDSPEAAASWGPSNLCCWTRAGHGLAADFATQVDAGGAAYFAGLGNSAERAAFAMDQMGVDHAELRLLKSRNVFDSAARCGAEILELSHFRLLANLVRASRRTGP